MRVGICDVCGKETDVCARASVFAPFSYTSCQRCSEYMAEPYDTMVAGISCAGHFPEDIQERYQARVHRVLNYLGKTEEEFIRDVDDLINKVSFDSSIEQASEDEQPGDRFRPDEVNTSNGIN